MHLYTWLIAHAAQIALVASFLAADPVTRALASKLGAEYPRAAHALRAVGELCASLIGAGKRIYLAWAGHPFSLADLPRASVAPPLPIQPKDGGT